MFEDKLFLMIPGPTPVPHQALLELAKAPLPHRSKEFSTKYMEVSHMLKQIAKTEKAEVLLYTASGTGAMEGALVNVLSRGDKVLSIVNGVFSQRWADMAARYGANVDIISVDHGHAIDIQLISDYISKNSDLKMILITFSETSTGAKNPIQDIANFTKDTSILLAVDAITGLGAMPLYMDDWGIDIVISGSQKGFMIPPGLSFIWFSQKAYTKHLAADCPRYYWDWTLGLKALKNQTSAFTPNTNLIVALHYILNLMIEEGIENIWARHQDLMTMTREGIRDMGLELFTEDHCASAAITAIKKPPHTTIADLRSKLKSQYHIVVADGQGDLQGKIFRIGHLGYVCQRDVLTVLAALREVLNNS